MPYPIAKYDAKTHAPAVAGLDAPVTEPAELTGMIKTLTDAIVRGEHCHVTHLMARKALHLAEDAMERLDEQTERITALERDALTDGLTGLLNRRGFELELDKAADQARRYKETGALIFIDLDRFKKINDTYGHGTGDAVLQKVSSVLARNLRKSDRVSRFGGDEFAVIMPRTNMENARRRADDLSSRLNNAAIIRDGRSVDIRASLGIQLFGPRDERKDIVQGADQAMYQMKRRRAVGPVIVPSLIPGLVHPTSPAANDRHIKQPEAPLSNLPSAIG